MFLACGGALAQKVAPAATAQYPAKSIRVIIPGTTGDTCDTMLRLIGHTLMEKTGYGFVMDNLPGAVGQIGLGFIAQAPADGYTIGCGQGGNMVIVPLAYRRWRTTALRISRRSR